MGDSLMKRNTFNLLRAGISEMYPKWGGRGGETLIWMWTAGVGQLTESIAHMMQTWKFHIKMETRTQNQGCQTARRVERKDRGKEKPKKMELLRSKHSRGCVPSAPCRGREHGREMVWIIIGQKSTHSMTLREGGRLRGLTGCWLGGPG